MGIKKLSKNKYQARYFAGYNSRGQRVYPSKTFHTQKDANAWLTLKLREKHLGQYAEGSTLSLEQFLDQWLQTKKQSVRENTFYTYTRDIENYIRHDIGKVKLASLRPLHIEQWQISLDKRGISGKTIQHVRGFLAGALERAVKHKLISSNPVRDAENVKAKQTEMKCLTQSEAVNFLSQCEGHVGLILKLMLNTGLRPEEAVAVRWQDLTLEERGSVKVRVAVLRIPGGGWKFESPKTSNSLRKVGFPASLVASLKEHRKEQLEQRMKVRKHYKDHDLVFATAIGEPFARGRVRRQFKKTLERARLSEKIRLYDLRHSFVTLSLVAGVDLKTVSEEAGHATVAFTLDNYGHVLQVMRESAVDKREALFAAR